MTDFAKELEKTLRGAVDAWRESLAHIGGRNIPYRTGIVVRKGLVATLARSARDGEEVPVVTAAGETHGRVEAWDAESGLTLIRADTGGKPVPEPASAVPEEPPPVGTPLLRLAFASPQGVEASLSVVRFTGGPTEWGRIPIPAHFQLDGAAFPGFLGAAVADLAGGLRGVVVSNGDGNDGWVLPAGPWRAAVEELEREGSRVRGWLGALLMAVRLSPRQAEASGREAALLVRGVSPEGPAAEAGLEPGDLVLAVDGRAVPDGKLPPLRAGVPASLEILRGEALRTFQVTPAARP